ncbi:MAG TPA: 30S ribosomal protein S14 [Nannocystis sp.]|jgi:small subunit ribosomal protein S14
MAKKSAVEKNEHRKRLVDKFKTKRAELKKVVMDRSIELQDRFDATLKLAAMPRNGSRTRIRNRCLLTGRPRAYYRKFGLSRIALRDLASEGRIPGVVKSSW